MKKLLLLTLIIFTYIPFLNGQGLQAKSYLEYTHISPKFGTSVGYFFVDQVELGGFFQRSTEILEPEAGRPLTAEAEFYGAYFAYPLLARPHTSIKFNVRTGVSNGQNFVITPSIMASYQPLKNVAIGGGIGTRSFRPTYMATISIRLNNKPKALEFLASNTESH